MGKKNKVKKEKEKELEPKDEEAKDNKKVNEEENKDKVSLKKCFRDTVIILFLIVGIVGVLWFVNRDAELKPSNGEGNGDEPVEQVVEVNESVLSNKLMGVANKYLNEAKNEEIRTKDYVSDLCSFEYRPDKVVFCALGDKVEGESYLVKITISSDFSGDADFAKKMCSLNSSFDTIDYEVKAEYFDVVEDESLDNRFAVQFAPDCQGYRAEKALHRIYKVAEDTINTYFSLIYLDDDDIIHSTNQVTYDSSINRFSTSTEYRCYDPESTVYKMLKAMIHIA